MLQRVRRATILAVTVAVMLLGLPLGFVGYLFWYSTEVGELQNISDSIARSVSLRINSGETITQDYLETQLGQGAVPYSIIVVVTENGAAIRAGEPSDGRIVAVTSSTESATVRVTAPWLSVFWRSMYPVVLVVVLAVIAFLAGIFVASRQSRRLAAPLVYLAASAEQLGSGQVRPRLEPSGIEEIDLVQAELARSADRMAGRLAAERQFASDASHQLRTPLTALSMRLEEIQAISDDDAVREEARISLEQIERLVSTVDELLGKSRRAGAMSTVEAVHLDEVAAQQREEWEPIFAAENRRLVIDVPDDMTVLATPGALAQVLATLLENSVKHGGGTTTVAARRTGPRGGVVIEVSDQGRGVPDELAPRVFERNVTSGKGTGLGLALARDLVAADGGRLELASRRPAVFAVFLSGVPKAMDPDVVLPAGAAVPAGAIKKRWWQR